MLAGVLPSACAACSSCSVSCGGSGRIVAEFDCGSHARDYAKAHGYSVTAGVNRLFAVREIAS